MTQKDKAPDEREDPGAVGNRVYLLYIVLVLVLFLGLCLVAYLGYKNDWVPSR